MGKRPKRKQCPSIRTIKIEPNTFSEINQSIKTEIRLNQIQDRINQSLQLIKTEIEEPKLQPLSEFSKVLKDENLIESTRAHQGSVKKSKIEVNSTSGTKERTTSANQLVKTASKIVQNRDSIRKNTHQGRVMQPMLGQSVPTNPLIKTSVRDPRIQRANSTSDFAPQTIYNVANGKNPNQTAELLPPHQRTLKQGLMRDPRNQVVKANTKNLNVQPSFSSWDSNVVVYETVDELKITRQGSTVCARHQETQQWSTRQSHHYPPPGPPVVKPENKIQILSQVIMRPQQQQNSDQFTRQGNDHHGQSFAQYLQTHQEIVGQAECHPASLRGFFPCKLCYRAFRYRESLITHYRFHQRCTDIEQDFEAIPIYSNQK